MLLRCPFAGAAAASTLFVELAGASFLLFEFVCVVGASPMVAAPCAIRGRALAASVRPTLLLVLALAWTSFHLGVWIVMPHVNYIPSALIYLTLIIPWASNPASPPVGDSSPANGASERQPDGAGGAHTLAGQKAEAGGTKERATETTRLPSPSPPCPDPGRTSSQAFTRVALQATRVVLVLAYATAALTHSAFWPATNVPMFAALRDTTWNTNNSGRCLQPHHAMQVAKEASLSGSHVSPVGTSASWLTLTAVGMATGFDAYECSFNETIIGIADLPLSTGKLTGTGYTPLECATECDANPACKSHVFGGNNGYCELWTKSGPLTYIDPATFDYDHCVRLDRLTRILVSDLDHYDFLEVNSPTGRSRQVMSVLRIPAYHELHRHLQMGGDLSNGASSSSVAMTDAASCGNAEAPSEDPAVRVDESIFLPALRRFLPGLDGGSAYKQLGRSPGAGSAKQAKREGTAKDKPTHAVKPMATGKMHMLGIELRWNRCDGSSPVLAAIRADGERMRCSGCADSADSADSAGSAHTPGPDAESQGVRVPPLPASFAAYLGKGHAAALATEWCTQLASPFKPRRLCPGMQLPPYAQGGVAEVVRTAGGLTCAAHCRVERGSACLAACRTTGYDCQCYDGMEEMACDQRYNSQEAVRQICVCQAPGASANVPPIPVV